MGIKPSTRNSKSNYSKQYPLGQRKFNLDDVLIYKNASKLVAGEAPKPTVDLTEAPTPSTPSRTTSSATPKASDASATTTQTIPVLTEFAYCLQAMQEHVYLYLRCSLHYYVDKTIATTLKNEITRFEVANDLKGAE